MKHLRAQDGMTLPEVLIAATIGIIVLGATLGLLDTTLRLTSGVMAKTDGMQRGRLAMDRVTQQLRSQVCLNLTTPAIVAGATADSITFYSDFSDGAPDKAPAKRQLTFNPTTGNITETVWAGTRTGDDTYTFNGTPRRNLILENAARQTRKKADGTTETVPFMTFFAFKDSDPSQFVALTPPLDSAEAARVARIDVAFVSRPTREPGSANGVNLEDRVSVRHADPNLTVPDPMCV